ncbi:MAG: cytochrome c [Planctomycetota bacterium]
MIQTKKITAIVALVLGALALGACRGAIKKSPPIHPVLDMDFQDKVKAQMSSDFAGFADHRGMRTPPAGTVWQGQLAWDAEGVFKNEGGEYVDNPLPADEAVVRRGRERFDIYCAVCHDRTASGNGLVLQRAKVVAPAAFNFALPHLAKEPRLVGSKDGYFFQVMTLGQGTMPSYASQLTPHDRWAIVHYLRVLQSRAQ